MREVEGSFSFTMKQDVLQVYRFADLRRHISPMKCDGTDALLGYTIVHPIPPPNGYTAKTPLMIYRHTYGGFGHLQDRRLPPYPLRRNFTCIKSARNADASGEQHSRSIHSLHGRMARNWPTGRLFDFRCPSNSIFLGFRPELPESYGSRGWTPLAIMDIVDLTNGLQLRVAHTGDYRLPPYQFGFLYHCARPL